MVIIKCSIDGQTLFIDKQGFWQLRKEKAVKLFYDDAREKIEFSGAVKEMKKEGGIISLEHP